VLASVGTDPVLFAYQTGAAPATGGTTAGRTA